MQILHKDKMQGIARLALNAQISQQSILPGSHSCIAQEHLVKLAMIILMQRPEIWLLVQEIADGNFERLEK